MKIIRVAIASLMFLVSVSAVGQSAAERQDQKAGTDAYTDCLAVYAAKYDDGISDVSSIARAIFPFCELQFERSLLPYMRGMSSGSKAMVRQGALEHREALASAMVLTVRRMKVKL